MTTALTARDRAGADEVLLQLAAGIDEGDRALIGTTVVADAMVDFGPCGDKLGLAFPPLEGGDAIAAFLGATHGHQITSHVVTNMHFASSVEGLELRALVEATHIARADPGHHFRMLDTYATTLVRDRGDWRISRLVIDNIWFEGDPRIMLCRGDAS